MEQQTGSKLEKEVHQGFVRQAYSQPAYLTYMQGTSWEMPGWMKHKLESRLPGEISNLRYANETTLMIENKKELKSL